MACLVGFHYLQRSQTAAFLFMLAFRVVIKLFFILDFERMSSVSETQVMISFSLITFVCTGLHLVHEYITRVERGLNHFPRLTVYVWLAMVSANESTQNKVRITERRAWYNQLRSNRAELFMILAFPAIQPPSRKSMKQFKFNYVVKVGQNTIFVEKNVTTKFFSLQHVYLRNYENFRSIV